MTAEGTGVPAGDPDATPFEWRDFSRFVRVSPVATGWLVLWGTYFDQGARSEVSGSRLYASRTGVIERVAAAAAEVTGRTALATEAEMRCRQWFGDRHGQWSGSDGTGA